MPTVETAVTMIKSFRIIFLPRKESAPFRLSHLPRRSHGPSYALVRACTAIRPKTAHIGGCTRIRSSLVWKYWNRYGRAGRIRRRLPVNPAPAGLGSWKSASAIASGDDARNLAGAGQVCYPLGKSDKSIQLGTVPLADELGKRRPIINFSIRMVSRGSSQP
jgi:hypothetical protein